jgi:uncharacterized protein YoxC
MNIAVDAVGPAVAEVEKLLSDADAAVADAIRKVARLIDKGVGAAEDVGIPAVYLDEVLSAATEVTLALGEANSWMRALHRALHPVKAKLEASAGEKGGGFGKGD